MVAVLYSYLLSSCRELAPKELGVTDDVVARPLDLTTLSLLKLPCFILKLTVAVCPTLRVNAFGVMAKAVQMSH